MKVNSGQPKCSVIFKASNRPSIVTEQIGEADSSVIVVSTNKDLNSPSGNFTIVIAPKTDKEKRTWFEMLEVFDYVEIRMKGINDDEEKIIMRGLIDSISKSEDYSSGQPNISITVSGRDLSCLLTDFGVYYLHTVSPEDAVKNVIGMLGWNSREGVAPLTMNSKSVFEFILNKWETCIDIRLNQAGTEWDILTLIKNKSESMFPQAETDLMSVNGFEGSFWNLFSMYQDKPFHELIWYDHDDYSYLVLRPTKYKDSNGSVHPRVKDLIDDEILYPPDFKFDSSFKVSSTLSKSISNGIYNYYFMMPVHGLLPKEALMSLFIGEDLKGSKNPYFQVDKNLPAYSGKYGIRKLETNTNYVRFDIGQHNHRNEEYKKYMKDEFTDLGISMNNTVVSWFLHNAHLIGGNIVIGGTNKAKVGVYVEDSDEKPSMQYYVEGVQNQFTVFGNYLTTLRVTRGQPSAGGVSSLGIKSRTF